MTQLRPCPVCHEPIQPLAKKCRFCMEYLEAGWASPEAVLDLKVQPDESEEPIFVNLIQASDFLISEGYKVTSGSDLSTKVITPDSHEITFKDSAELISFASREFRSQQHDNSNWEANQNQENTSAKQHQTVEKVGSHKQNQILSGTKLAQTSDEEYIEPKNKTKDRGYSIYKKSSESLIEKFLGALAIYVILIFSWQVGVQLTSLKDEFSNNALKALAESGEASAQHDLGVVYFEGKDVPQDYTEAAIWFHKAANQEFAAAQNYLGVMYASGDGVPQDYAEAAKWYRKAADQGNAKAQLNLGGMYNTGEGEQQDYAEAAIWIRKSANQGLAAAQNYLGVMYASGDGVPQDYAEAAKWFRKAADQGNAIAQAFLGEMYLVGKGVAQDYTEAAIWFHKAANQGLAATQYALGAMYQFGNGVPQDYTEAAIWFHKAANQGNADAQISLGFMYQLGNGVTQDNAEAMIWYRKAADQGNAEAQDLILDLRGKLLREDLDAYISQQNIAGIDQLIQQFSGTPYADDVRSAKRNVLRSFLEKQRLFEEKQIEFESQYDETGNQVKKSQIFNEANSWSTKYMQNDRYQFKNWEGKLTSVNTNKGGDYALIRIRSRTTFYLANVPSSDSVYQKFFEVEPGSIVLFSGGFNIIGGNLSEDSLYELGRMWNPEFQIHLTDISIKHK